MHKVGDKVSFPHPETGVTVEGTVTAVWNSGFPPAERVNVKTDSGEHKGIAHDLAKKTAAA